MGAASSVDMTDRAATRVRAILGGEPAVSALASA